VFKVKRMKKTVITQVSYYCTTSEFVDLKNCGALCLTTFAKNTKYRAISLPQLSETKIDSVSDFIFVECHYISPPGKQSTKINVPVKRK